MNIQVRYYTRSGNTKKLADAIAASVNAECASVDCELKEKADKVYDLTVEDSHEFFANGVLVHNCIDALRYACLDTLRGNLFSFD